MPIDLPPSNDTDALSKAILKATTTGETLRLLPGTHLTKPRVLIQTQIGPKGLTLIGPGSIDPHNSNAARIQRPDLSIGTDPLKRTDDNYGIYFVPSHPEPDEIARIEWLTYPPFHDKPYGIIIRGDINISGITVDCNMGNQGLDPQIPKGKIEHSAMLVFSGLAYPQKDGRKIFVGFNRVTLGDTLLTRGGFADDIMIFPGFFRPNIQRLEFSGIVSSQRPSEQRVNTRRASLGFSGLAQEVLIRNCSLEDLHVEPDGGIWSTFPGPPPKDLLHFQESAWSLDKIRSKRMGFGAKGRVQTITAANLDVAETFEVSFAAGSISDSRLAVSDQNRRLFSLRDFQFRNCVWTIGQQAGGNVRGVELATDNNRPFGATFDGNTFATPAGFQSGQLIDTGDFNKNPDPRTHTRVTATFHQCKYQPGFATTDLPKTHIARLRQQGDYTFSNSDFSNVNSTQAVDAQNDQTTVQGDDIIYHIA